MRIRAGENAPSGALIRAPSETVRSMQGSSPAPPQQEKEKDSVNRFHTDLNNYFGINKLFRQFWEQ